MLHFPCPQGSAKRMVFERRSMLANQILTQFQCRWQRVNFVRFSVLDQPIGKTGKNLPVFNAFSKGSRCLKHGQSGSHIGASGTPKLANFLIFH